MQWLSMTLWQLPEGVFFWVQINNAWTKLKQIKNPRLFYWYHACLEIEIKNSTFSAAVNGEFTGTVALETNFTNSPSNLRMTIGDWANFDLIKVQFHGSVSNLQVFTTSSNPNITTLSSEPCRYEGDMLSWRAEDWRVEGTRWVMEEETKESVCDQENTYAVAIPVEMGIHKAMDICRKKLKNGIMPYQEDHESLQSFAVWYNMTTGGACNNIWAPFADDKSEGQFLNMNDDSEAKILFWAYYQPNGGTQQNFVSLSTLTYLYNDVSNQAKDVCTSCLLHRSLLLRLDGLCEDSYIGDCSYLISYQPSDLTFTMTNTWSTVAYNGWRNTFIRCINYLLIFLSFVFFFYQSS